MRIFSKQELLDFITKKNLIRSAKRYKKVTAITFRIAEDEEEIITRLHNSFEECKVLAKKGDYIITNITGEQYVLHKEEFFKRYKPTDVGIAIPQNAIQFLAKISMSEEIEIETNFGRQKFREAFYLNVTNIDDIYGIAEKEFLETYELLK